MKHLLPLLLILSACAATTRESITPHNIHRGDMADCIVDQLDEAQIGLLEQPLSVTRVQRRVNSIELQSKHVAISWEATITDENVLLFAKYGEKRVQNVINACKVAFSS